ncbi:hypothetical protein KQX54_012066 [Cotesia glomerata]|uniref:DUF7041 domain-containing protein n=1 Tax=Cotesia glomerata TaxID=32391 RepID=A0AAV7HXE3_COTGL|nr:hypothetical protein KQX54_012066 [Cotesia glomerata]
MVNGEELNGGNAVTVVASQRFPENRIIDKQQQYLQVLSSIPSRYVTEVRDIIMKPLSAALYDELKEQLIKRLSISQE